MSIQFLMIDFTISCYFIFLRFYVFIFRQKGREGESEGEKHQCVVSSRAPPTGDLAQNPGMCPDGNQTSDPLVHIGCHSIH